MPNDKKWKSTDDPFAHFTGADWAKFLRDRAAATDPADLSRVLRLIVQARQTDDPDEPTGFVTDLISKGLSLTTTLEPTNLAIKIHGIRKKKEHTGLRITSKPVLSDVGIQARYRTHTLQSAHMLLLRLRGLLPLIGDENEKLLAIADVLDGWALAAKSTAGFEFAPGQALYAGAVLDMHGEFPLDVLKKLVDTMPKAVDYQTLDKYSEDGAPSDELRQATAAIRRAFKKASVPYKVLNNRSSSYYIDHA